jgi:hypothetical protein
MLGGDAYSGTLFNMHVAVMRTPSKFTEADLRRILWAARKENVRVRIDITAEKRMSIFVTPDEDEEPQTASSTSNDWDEVLCDQNHLPYVHEFTDRHGKPRRYFRRKGFKPARLPGQPGTKEFMAAYEAARENGARLEIGKRAASGSVGALVSGYLASAAFKGLASETQRMRRGILEHFREEHGDKKFVDLTRKHVQAMVDAKANTPSAARNFLNVLRALASFAMDCGIRDDDPTFGVKRPKIRTAGLKTWTEEDIAAFENRHPVGTQARLAMALMLYTGQRRSDVCRFGPQNVRNRCIELRQQKTGKLLSIPIHPALQAIIERTPSKQLCFVTTARGKPFGSAASFGNWFTVSAAERQACRGHRSPRFPQGSLSPSRRSGMHRARDHGDHWPR